MSARHGEVIALLLVALLLAVLPIVPPIAQPQIYHQLADSRSLTIAGWVVPNSADVLSSLPFVLVGMTGLYSCRSLPAAQRCSLAVFFGGLALVGPGSVWYHLAPSDASLVWDRLPMSFAFAGALGALACERLGAAAGFRWLVGWFVLATGSVLVWVASADLRLYALAQFGGFAVLLLWVRRPPAPGMQGLPWGIVLVAYVLAKAFELLDAQIWVLSNGVVAGHALKHLAVAAGVVPMLLALSASNRRTRQPVRVARGGAGDVARADSKRPTP